MDHDIKRSQIGVRSIKGTVYNIQFDVFGLARHCKTPIVYTWELQPTRPRQEKAPSFCLRSSVGARVYGGTAADVKGCNGYWGSV